MQGNDIIIAAIVAIPPTLMALASLIASIRNGGKLSEVRHEFNSKMDEAIKVSNDAAFARGEKHELGKKKPTRRKHH